MVVCIRLARFGRRNRPFYRLTVADSRRRRDGKFIEQIGFYNPLVIDGAKRLRLNTERARYWISVGAQPSDTVCKIFERANILPPLPRHIPLPSLPPKFISSFKPKWLTTPSMVIKHGETASPIVEPSDYDKLILSGKPIKELEYYRKATETNTASVSSAASESSSEVKPL